jgi:hypothetical protein
MTKVHGTIFNLIYAYLRMRLYYSKYLLFIDPERGGFGVILPEVMVFSEGLSCPRVTRERGIL